MKKDKSEQLCAYCESASPLVREDEFLCSRHGVVKGFYKCRHFSYDPVKRKPSKPTNPPLPLHTLSDNIDPDK